MFFDDQQSKTAITARKSFDVEPNVKMKKKKTISQKSEILLNPKIHESSLTKKSLG